MMNTDYNKINVQFDEGVCSIALNRPDRLNAVVKPLYNELLEVLKEVETRAEINVIVLTGNGRAFCVGADLKAHKEGRTDTEKREYLNAEQQVCAAIFNHPKTIVAAVHGYAIGAGFEIALNCDFIISSQSAEYMLPEIDLGTFVGGGVCWLLPRLIGLAKARQLLAGNLSTDPSQENKRINAAQLKEMGLITHIFADDLFAEHSKSFGRLLAEKPAASLVAMKQITRQSLQCTYNETLDKELIAMQSCSSSGDWLNSIASITR